MADVVTYEGLCLAVGTRLGALDPACVYGVLD
jgi:hypothetical protein